MRTHWLCVAACSLALLPAGCRRAAPPMPLPPGVAAEDRQTRLAEKIDLDLGAWLALPRAEQAKLAEEWSETIEKQLTAIRNNPLSLDLLPKTLPPITVPVLHKAAFAESVGFSLPPYAEAGKQDAGLALHYARHGDHEAAMKLAPEDLRSRINAWKTEKNYPVEWTRLVALVQRSAELKLATRDLDGASLLVGVHRQLVDLLDEKAATGPLGAALLGTGKTALQRAATILRDKKHNKPALAADIDTAVGAWGNVPPAELMVGFAAPLGEVRALFGTAERGKVFLADTPKSVGRAVDLLGIPLPGEGVQVVAAFLDGEGRLAEWQLAYRSRIDTLYPSPAHLAYRLDEIGYKAGPETRITNLDRQPFSTEKVMVEVARTNRSPALGAHVQLTPPKDRLRAASTRSLRDFGPVHLDRGFETMRLGLSPALAANPAVVVKEAGLLKRMADVLDTPTPETVVLMRERQADLLDLLEMAWAPTVNDHALDRLLPSLWDDYGPGRLDVIEDQAGSYLGLTWQDRTTRVRLRLAFDERGPILSARDIQSDEALAARATLAGKLDEQDRQARLSASKAMIRLSRSPGRINEVAVPELTLGMSKGEAEKLLPSGKNYRRQDLADGVSVVFLTAPERTQTYWGRQLLLRYAEGRIAEMRVRYQRGPATPKQGEPLLQSLVESNGAPEQVRPRWEGLWVDLQHPGKVVEYRWRDDRTVRIYRGDATGMEVILLDRPAEMTSLDVPVWNFVSTGIAHCHLGDTREKVEEYFKTPATTSADGGSVYRTASSSPYEMLLVWYEKDRVSRILAVHRDRPGSTPKEVAEALSRDWGKHLGSLGYTRRQEGASGHVLGAYAWNDDRVRVRTSVQTTDQGPRIMTEWRTYPPTATKSPAAPVENDPTKADG